MIENWKCCLLRWRKTGSGEDLEECKREKEMIKRMYERKKTSDEEWNVRIVENFK